MTLGEGKRKVLELLDEYGDGSSADEELEARMPDLFDMAQKRLSGVRRIVKYIELAPGETELPLPEDCAEVYRVWRNGEVCRERFRERQGCLLLPDGKGAGVEYFAVPETVDEDTADGYVFPLREDAAQCMPFLVAGTLLAADPLQDGGVLLGLYEQMVRELPRERREEQRRVSRAL